MRVIPVVIALLVFGPEWALGQPHITSPKEAFGANYGDDYFLATYRQIAGYWKQLDRESDRLVRLARSQPAR